MGISGTTAAKKIYEILDTPVTNDRYPVISDQFGKEITSIDFENVSFAYPHEITQALQNINLTINKGQHIALIGKTGAGKSTLVNLLLRFMEPTSGIISINQVPLTNIPPDKWGAASLSWVPQRPHLFHDTIAANIRIGKADATNEEIIIAAQAADLHEFIELLPQKYETNVGESGASSIKRASSTSRPRAAFLKTRPSSSLMNPPPASTPKPNCFSKNPRGS